MRFKHQTKCVLNGSPLGKQCSAKSIFERLEQYPISSTNKGIIQRSPSEKSIPVEHVSLLSPTEKTMEGFDVLEHCKLTFKTVFIF